MEQLAVTLSTQLENLRRERERLDHLLMLDANWRALKQLEAREAAGEPLLAVDAVGLKSSLEQALATNRIYAARARLSETIDLLNGAGKPEPVPLANRIVLLNEPGGEGFRTRWRMKEKSPDQVPAPEVNALDVVSTPEVQREVQHQTASPEVESAARAVPAALAPGSLAPAPLADAAASKAVAPGSSAVSAPDALELIDGLGRSEVEQLIEGGVTRYADIADWKFADVELWRARLGADEGAVGSWIEQAAILASGRRTSYAGKARRGDFAVLVASPAPLPAPVVIVRPALSPLTSIAALLTSLEAPAAPAPTVTVSVPSSETVPVTAAVPADGGRVAAMIAAAVEPVAASERAASAGSRRLLSADELIRTLASATAAPAVPEAPALSVLRRAYVRPGPRPQAQAETHTGPGPEPSLASPREPIVECGLAQTGAAGDSEVIVVRRTPGAGAAGPGYTQAARPRPQRLLRRLKQALEPDRFEAEAYAAYRGVAEEASVTIVRSEPPRGRTAQPPAAESARAATGYNRFLKALTGQRH